MKIIDFEIITVHDNRSTTLDMVYNNNKISSTHIYTITLSLFEEDKYIETDEWEPARSTLAHGWLLTHFTHFYGIETNRTIYPLNK